MLYDKYLFTRAGDAYAGGRRTAMTGGRLGDGDDENRRYPQGDAAQGAARRGRGRRLCGRDAPGYRRGGRDRKSGARQPARYRHLHRRRPERSEEHTSELQSLMRTSHAAFCLKTKTTATPQISTSHHASTHTTLLSHLILMPS